MPATSDRVAVRLSGSPWLAASWAKRGGDVALPPPRLEGYTKEQIAIARAAWPMKAAEEFRSASIYAALASAATHAGLPLDLVALVASTSIDELRHAALCAAVARALGDETPIEASMGVVRARTANDRPRALALELLLVEVAMGETVSCALFRTGRDATTEPLIRAALSSILRDEARHARSGWEALSALRGDLAPGELDELQREATAQLGLMEQSMALPSLRRLEANEPFDAKLVELGVLGPERRVEAFYAAIEGSVQPRLDRLGLDGQRAWADRYRVRP